VINIKIAVCIKQVPATTEIRIDPQTNTLIRQGIENITNPYDTYALEEAVRIKEKLDSDPEFSGEVEVLAVTMGPPQAENMLREAISAGADSAVLLSDRAFAGADTWATAATLSMALKKIGSISLVISGKQTLDGDTGQVGPQLAHIMGLPFIGYVSSIESITKSGMKVKRLAEENYEEFEIKFPAAISVLKDINTPRVPSLRGRIKAKKAEIPVWTAADINADSEEVGLKGSCTRVVKIFTPRITHDVKMIEGTLQEQVEELFSRLKESNIV
jgi:electron transfer flavoprotein beta subunit